MEIEVRLRFPNLGANRGDIVRMDAETARVWCQRGLAEMPDAEPMAVLGDTHPLAALIDPLTMLGNPRSESAMNARRGAAMSGPSTSPAGEREEAPIGPVAPPSAASHAG